MKLMHKPDYKPPEKHYNCFSNMRMLNVYVCYSHKQEFSFICVKKIQLALLLLEKKK